MKKFNLMLALVIGVFALSVVSASITGYVVVTKNNADTFNVKIIQKDLVTLSNGDQVSIGESFTDSTGKEYTLASIDTSFFRPKKAILVEVPKPREIAPKISYPLSLGMNNTNEINSTNTINSTTESSCYDELVSLRDYIDMLIASCDPNGSGLVGSPACSDTITQNCHTTATTVAHTLGGACTYTWVYNVGDNINPSSYGDLISSSGPGC